MVHGNATLRRRSAFSCQRPGQDRTLCNAVAVVSHFHDFHIHPKFAGGVGDKWMALRLWEMGKSIPPRFEKSRHYHPLVRDGGVIRGWNGQEPRTAYTSVQHFTQSPSHLTPLLHIVDGSQAAAQLGGRAATDNSYFELRTPFGKTRI